MKRWRKLLLVAMLAWLLLFLSVLSHFLDLRAAVAPRARSAASGPSLSRTEIRRLASIQGGGGGGGKPGWTPGSSSSSTTTSSSSAPGSRDPGWGGAPRAPKVPRGEAPNGDTRDLSGLREGPRKKKTPSGGAKGHSWSPEVEEDWEERRRRRRLRIRMKRARRWSRRRGGGGGGVAAKRAENAAAEEEEEEQEEEGGDYFLSRSKAVVQKLWKGDASADMLSARLQKALKDYLSANKHHVAYSGLRRPRQSGRQVLCELKRRARLRTLDGTEEPFASLGWARLVPPRPLDQLPPGNPGSGFGTCAVVTSAGAILNSSLGEEIDSHDAVLRFNAAPTKGFERDVGNRTTIRIINSQIVARPRHNFNSSSLYRDVALVAWDPAPYSVDLPKWYENPDYDLFAPYSERRRRRPDQPFYILHPAFIWDLWDVIQANTQENIQPNPPSSGFIGILLMMSLCREVDVYEYIPSVRQTDLCHYHEHYYDAACTLGAYHPLLYEKLLVQRMMSAAPERDLKRKGKVTLRGFSAVDCSADDP